MAHRDFPPKPIPKKPITKTTTITNLVVVDASNVSNHTPVSTPSIFSPLPKIQDITSILPTTTSTLINSPPPPNITILQPRLPNTQPITQYPIVNIPVVQKPIPVQQPNIAIEPTSTPIIIQPQNLPNTQPPPQPIKQPTPQPTPIKQTTQPQQETPTTENTLTYAIIAAVVVVGIIILKNKDI